MLKKRFYQFVRSRGQWAMGFAVPITIAIIAGVLLSAMPSQLIEGTDPPTFASVSSAYPTYLAGQSEVESMALLKSAFPNNEIDPVYVGSSYSSLYNEVDANAAINHGTISIDGVVYDSMTNFTVMYNASFPVNFPGNRLISQ
jgi:hypothetical protein